MVMARRQVLVQLNEELLARLDERAARSGRSRSELVREAIERDLVDEREREIDRAIVDGYARIPEEPDPWIEEVGRRSIAEEPW